LQPSESTWRRAEAAENNGGAGHCAFWDRKPLQAGLTETAICGGSRTNARRLFQMNRFEGPGAREARIRYLDGDFQVMSPGAFVRCAVTGESIPIDELKYWSVARQEPYANVAASLQREVEMDPSLRKRG
jgi:hypothetical protein